MSVELGQSLKTWNLMRRSYQCFFVLDTMFGFESSPIWTFEFFQNRQIWAIWGAKVAKFNGFECSPACTQFEPLAVPKWLNLTVLNPPPLEPLNFFRIAKFEPFGVPKWLNLTVLNLPCRTQFEPLEPFEPLNFFRIAKFEPFGVPKWLNLTVLNLPCLNP